MYWNTSNLKAEMKIRQSMQYHQTMLDKQRQKLAKLYDKVHKQNKRE